VRFLNGTLTVTFSPLNATDVEIGMDPLHRVIPNPTTTVTFSHTALQYNFSTNFATAVSSTTTNVVSSDIAPISSLAPPQSLPSLSSLLFPSLPLPPRWSLIPIDSQWTDRTLAQPYVSDPADVKLERSTSPAADRGLESLSTSRRLDANEPTSSMGVRPVAAGSSRPGKDDEAVDSVASPSRQSLDGDDSARGVGLIDDDLDTRRRQN